MANGYAPITDPVHRQKGTRPSLPIVKPADLAGKDIPVRQWCVPGWFPDRTVSLLTGDGGTGKSLLAMQLATCAALGLPFLGMELVPRNVLYVACEDDTDEMHRRQADICQTIGCNFAELGDRLFWIPMVVSDAVLVQADKHGRMTTTSTYDQVRQKCRELQIRLLIIDTAADTFGGLEIDRQQVTRYIRNLEAIAREIGGAVILLSHPSVAGLRDRTGISGNTAWRNAVRSVVHMSRPDAEHETRGDTAHLRFLERLKGNYAATGGRLSLMYCDGAFVLDGPDDDGRPQLDQLTVEHKVKTAIKAAYRNGQRPSPSINSTDWAVKMVQPSDHCRELTKAQIDKAISRMLAKGELRIAHVWNGKNNRQVLVSADTETLDGERQEAGSGGSGGPS